MDSLPLVSILIDNYNYDRFLTQAIESALNQTYPHVEVIVVDDGSTDNSRDVILSYGDRIIPVLKENGGQASAFNAAFECSHGEILFFLDADDVFLPNKVEQMVGLFDQIRSYNPDVLIFHSLEIIGNTGKRLDVDPAVDPLRGSCEWKDLDATKERKAVLDGALLQISTAAEVLKHANKYRYIPYLASPTSGFALTRSLAAQIFPLPCQGIKTCADDFLVKAASLLGDIYSSNEVFAQYRVHGNNNWWYQHKKPVKREFLHSVDDFLNTKLQQQGKQPIFSYFNSTHARVYYRGNCKNLRSYSAELMKLATRAITWHVDLRTVKLFIKALCLVAYSQFKSLDNTFKQT
jgi:glycosyltransferase involved in cell wall biosynthesis